MYLGYFSGRACAWHAVKLLLAKSLPFFDVADDIKKRKFDVTADISDERGRFDIADDIKKRKSDIAEDISDERGRFDIADDIKKRKSDIAEDIRVFARSCVLNN